MDREIDREICSWMLEFLLRRSSDEALLKKLIEALPSPPLHGKPRLKKTLLLHSIKKEIVAGNVSEQILDHLEMIECVDCSQKHKIQPSMKEAYCAVALDCTAKYLAGGWNRYDNYLAAVNRIWRGRIENLEISKASKLVTEQLISGRRQVEAAVGDEEVANCLIRTNTRNNAILALRLYLCEAFDLMGPPLLEREMGSVSGV